MDEKLSDFIKKHNQECSSLWFHETYLTTPVYTTSKDIMTETVSYESIESIRTSNQVLFKIGCGTITYAYNVSGSILIFLKSGRCLDVAARAVEIVEDLFDDALCEDSVHRFEDYFFLPNYFSEELSDKIFNKTKQN